MAASLSSRARPRAPRQPKSPPPAPPPPPEETGARPVAAALVALLCAALAAWTFRGALGTGFAQDDWTGLARARGLAEPLLPGWRWLSHQLFWQWVAGPLGGDPRAAHAVVLAGHAAAAAVLALSLCRRLGAPAALIGGAFYATHFAQFTAVYWASANGDVFAVLFALLALLACGRAGLERWLAAPLFLLALLAKESVLGLPLQLAALASFAPERAGARAPWRDPLAWTLVAIALAWFVLLKPGREGAALGDVAYALDPRAMVPNLLTYAGWTADAWIFTVRDVGDRVAPAEFAWALGLFGAWLAACAIRPVRERGALAGLLAFVAMLLPVLPLSAHTYHYYLVAGLPAASLLGSSLADALFTRLPRALAWTAAVAVAALLGANGSALATKLEHAPFRLEGLRADPIVDRAGIATRALADLRRAALPRGTVLRLWSPQAQAIAAADGVPADREGYFEGNLREALAGGLAVRVTFPQVDSATFVRAFAPGGPRERWAVLRYDGRLAVLTADSLARLLASAPPNLRAAPRTSPPAVP